LVVKRGVFVWKGWWVSAGGAGCTIKAAAAWIIGWTAVWVELADELVKELKLEIELVLARVVLRAIIESKAEL
jgi:hypothetical protein